MIIPVTDQLKDLKYPVVEKGLGTPEEKVRLCVNTCRQKLLEVVNPNR